VCQICVVETERAYCLPVLNTSFRFLPVATKIM
jgi:hypothetical protein